MNVRIVGINWTTYSSKSLESRFVCLVKKKKKYPGSDFFGSQNLGQANEKTHQRKLRKW